MKIPNKFPKVQSLYEREETNGRYLVTGDVKDDFSWVVDNAEQTRAVEKIDGKNTAVYIDECGTVDMAMTRDHVVVQPYKPQHKYIVRGIQNTLGRGYIKEQGQWVFGETVGPNIKDNPYELDEHLFIPFNWLMRKCTYESFGEYPTDFESISNWFQENIFSLFEVRMHGKEYSEASVSNGGYVEGVMFIHPDIATVSPNHIPTVPYNDSVESTNMLAKLRRDMFEWY